MHTTGQAFAMAFQAGGPHAQDRGLEAVAYAFQEMTRTPAQAVWTKPQGKAEPIVLEKHWRIVPRGVSLVIGCQTFPTWNSYPGLFANLATGNTVIIKPHPGAILPLAITVSVIRQVLAEEDLTPNIALLAADAPAAEITRDLVENDAVSIIDYTGSNSFGNWLRRHAGEAQLYTEEAGVNSIVVAAADDFCRCAPTSPSPSPLQRPDVHRAAGTSSVQERHRDEPRATELRRSCRGTERIDDLVADPAAPPALRRYRQSGNLKADRDSPQPRKAHSRPLPRSTPEMRTATPLVLAVDADRRNAHEKSLVRSPSSSPLRMQPTAS